MAALAIVTLSMHPPQSNDAFMYVPKPIESRRARRARVELREPRDPYREA